MTKHDRDLGMDRPITRRDFLNGVAVGSGALVLAPWLQGCGGGGDEIARPVVAPAPVPAPIPENYPPALTGLRGSHEGAYTAAHALKDGQFRAADYTARDTGERYDLVVVGGGISGLAAAWFYRARAGAGSRILVLDNHDDFGGHARRNEFRVNGRLLLGYGGTQSIQSPAKYSRVARTLLSELGVDTGRFYKAFDQKFYESRGLKSGVFFDAAVWGRDHLVVGVGEVPWEQLLDGAPVAPVVKMDIAWVHEGGHDYMQDLTSAQKKTLLARISYLDYLRTYAKVHPDSLRFFQTETHGLYGVGIDAVPALDLWALGYPGFEGLQLEPGPAPGMSRTAILDQDDPEPYIFHFPDGNASIARLLVRSLVPASAPGRTMDDIVTARLDYGKLDEADSPVRIRLNSTVVNVRHVGRGAERAVEVSYARGKELARVTASRTVLACWNGVIPHICPEIPEAQKEALAYGVKVPLVYTNVALANWTAFQKLGVRDISAPNAYHTAVSLDFPVSMGGYAFAQSPSDPIVVHMLRTPCLPGKPARDQHRAGRLELLSTSFETFERNIRDQLGRMLAGGGFDPARDIQGITVNRWAHGYAYEYNSLWDPVWPKGKSPCEIGRRPVGRIAIANADAAAFAYTDAAIDEAHRAVGELTTG
jgi:spermidine dehydrogenase